MIDFGEGTAVQLHGAKPVLDPPEVDPRRDPLVGVVREVKP